MQPPEAVAVATVDVVVNVQTGSVSVEPPTQHVKGENGKLAYHLDFVPGPSDAGVRAYLALRKHGKLLPDEATKADGFQDDIFPLRDVNDTGLTPTFLPQSDGQETVQVLVLFPEGSPYSCQPSQSVVIIDW